MNIQERIEALETEFNEKIKTLKAEVQREQEFPQDGYEYYVLTTTGSVSPFVWTDDNIDLNVQAVGNIFRTEEEAEFVVEKLKVEAELRKFSRQLEVDSKKFYILWSEYEKDIEIDWSVGFIRQGAIYFDSRYKAQQAIETVGEERIKKYIFGVED